MTPMRYYSWIIAIQDDTLNDDELSGIFMNLSRAVERDSLGQAVVAWDGGQIEKPSTGMVETAEEKFQAMDD